MGAQGPRVTLRGGDQMAEPLGEIAALEQVQKPRHQCRVRHSQAQLRRHAPGDGGIEARFGPFDHGAQIRQRLFRVFRRDQGGQRFRQPRKVPPRQNRLVAIGITPPMIDRGKHRPQIIGIQKGAGAIIDGFPRQGAIVGVHHPMHETNRHPLRDQLGLAFDHPVQKGKVTIRPAHKGGVMAIDRVIGQPLQPRDIAARIEELERPHPDMAGGHARQNRPRFHPLAIDALARGGGGQGAGRGDAKRAHRLAHQVFAQDRAKPRLAIAAARKGRGARPFQMDVKTPPGWVQHLAQQKRAAIAQLRGKAAELMPGIGHGQPCRPFGQARAGQHGHAIGRLQEIHVQPQRLRQRQVQHDQRRIGRSRAGHGQIKPLQLALIGIVEGDGHGKHSCTTGKPRGGGKQGAASNSRQGASGTTRPMIGPIGRPQSERPSAGACSRDRFPSR